MLTKNSVREIHTTHTAEISISDLVKLLNCPIGSKIMIHTPGSPGSYASQQEISYSGKLVATWKVVEKD